MAGAGKSSKTGGSAKGRQHIAHKGKYLRQWGRTAKHKELAWKKHLAKHPKDEAAKKNIALARPKLTSYKGMT